MEFWRKLKFRWDSNVTTVLDDYEARSSQELSVSKGQHVRIIQKTLNDAPDWCLIRILNEHQQPSPKSIHNNSSPCSVGASSTSIGVDPSSSKYIEGLVPASILKATKSSLSNVHLPPSVSLAQTTIVGNESEGTVSIHDELQQQTLLKRKPSFGRILKSRNKNLTLKTNSVDLSTIRSASSGDSLETSTRKGLTGNSVDGRSINKQQSLSLNSAASTQINTFTFTNLDDLTSLPDETSPNKISNDEQENDCFEEKMTQQIAQRNSPEKDLDDVFKEKSPFENSSTAPINIMTGLPVNDFHVPNPLSINEPTTTISVQNETQNEQIDQNTSTISPIEHQEQQPVDNRTKYGRKRRHNILELIETEKEYVKDLALIVEGYMHVIENDKEIKKPAGFVGRERVVFGNVQRIYEFHRDTFLPQLEQCIEDPDLLARLFTMNRFSPYVRYCENKPRSEYIVSEYHDYFEEIRKKLGQKLLVSDLLIKPVQRIMRYQLLLREILRSTERMGDESPAINGALKVMIEVPQQANDMMNVGRIKDLTTNVHQLGELKLQDMLLVTEPISKETKDVKEVEKKFKERRVFLFQQSMIFCDEIPAKDKYSSPNYIYKNELKINKLQHKEFKQNKDAFQFTLVELDAGNSRRVICQCKDDEQYKLWVTNVNKVLQRQMDLITALINPTAALQKDPRSK